VRESPFKIRLLALLALLALLLACIAAGANGDEKAELVQCIFEVSRLMVPDPSPTGSSEDLEIARLRAVSGASKAGSQLNNIQQRIHKLQKRLGIKAGRFLDFVDPESQPRVDAPAPAELARAIQHLSESPQNEELVLRQVAVLDRAMIVREKSSLGPDCVSGICGRSSDAVSFLLEEGRAKGIRIHSHAMSKWCYIPHAFDVVEFPSGRAYLVDLAWAQFDGASNLKTAVGARLRSFGPKGVAIAQALGSQGFVPLTDEVAQLYVDAFRQSTPPTARDSLKLIEKGQVPVVTTARYLTSQSTAPPHGYYPDEDPRSWGIQPIPFR
jgi:hypothetical protein